MKSLQPYLTRCYLSAVLFTAMSLPTLVSASGVYVGGIPKLPGGELNNETFMLGKLIYKGTIELPESRAVDSVRAASQQEVILKVTQAQLPAREQRSKDLPAMAGRLNGERFSALCHYTQHQYKVQLPDEVDVERYLAGESVYKKNADPDAKKVDPEAVLESLSGRISADESTALKYYLNLNYPPKN